MNKDFWIPRILIAWSAGVAIYTIYTMVTLWTP